MSENEQSPAPVVDAPKPEATTDSSTTPAVIDPNAPDPALPSGGDMVTGDAGNEPGANAGASTLEDTTGADSSPDNASLNAIAHPDGAPTPESDEPAEHTIVDINQDPAIAAYEADCLAAIEAGDTSWPTWGFLDLDKKLTYLLKSDAINSDNLG